MKLKVVLIFAIAIIIVLFTWLLFLRPQQLVKEAYYNRLLNQFDDTIISIDNLIVNEDKSKIAYKTYALSYELQKLDTMLEEGSYNIDSRINYHARTYDFSFIAEMITGRRRLKDEFIPLWLDNQLSEGELSYLSALQDELKIFANYLENEEIDHFFLQITNFFQNWNIEAEKNKHDESYYDYLIVTSN